MKYIAEPHMHSMPFVAVDPTGEMMRCWETERAREIVPFIHRKVVGVSVHEQRDIDVRNTHKLQTQPQKDIQGSQRE